VLGFILLLLLVGLVAGAVARLIVPGRDPMGCGATILLGIVGSFVGGFLGWLIFDRDDDAALRPSGLVGSIVGAVIVLLLLRAVTGGGGRARRGRSAWR
jgi:uncharacterized membrane protein YeaQ/YmgE (transglycosylase-associated protein family)